MADYQLRTGDMDDDEEHARGISGNMDLPR